MEPNKLVRIKGKLQQIVKVRWCTVWYQNGKIHRNGDKPAIIWKDGTKEWYRDGDAYTPQTHQ